MIEIKKLTKKYGTIQALDKITFEVESGTILGFLGPNGAGKSTAMRIITGYMPPTSGEVYVGKNSVVENPLTVKKMIGYLPEDNPLYEDLTPLEYFKFCGKLRGMTEAQIGKRVKEIAKVCGIENVLIQTIATLSKGYRQRVGLAQAIIHDPPILIMDEPTSGLDPNQKQEMRTLIRELGEEKTIILSTHIMEEVQATCERVVIINEGNIVADGTQDELIRSADKSVYNLEFRGPLEKIKEKLGKISDINKVIKRGGGFLVETDFEKDPRLDIFEMAKKEDWPIVSMYKTERSLEDVFRKLTTGSDG
ncbi:MAG: ATP-binding cassette domain-containing protein [Elusimicrobiota bacterium]